MDSSNKSSVDNAVEIEIIRSRQTELLGELKLAAKKEDELRDQNSKIELHFKDTIVRLESQLKNSTKIAAQQVMEISAKSKEDASDAELAKSQLTQSMESEKIAVSNANKLRAQLDLAVSGFEEMQQKTALEMAMLTRDLQDQRTKMKIFQESKAKLEAEVLGARTEHTRVETEKTRAKDKIKDLETKNRAAADELEAIKAELDRIGTDYKKLRVKAVSLEENAFKRSKEVELAVKERDQMERELTADLKRLRLQLQNSEHEVQELRALVPKLQREGNDSNATAKRLQETTNSTINGLLEELRNAENALSVERKVFCPRFFIMYPSINSFSRNALTVPESTRGDHELPHPNDRDANRSREDERLGAGDSSAQQAGQDG